MSRHHIVIALGVALAIGGCAVNPATGQRQLMLVSESQEIAMGMSYDTQVVATMGLYPDAALQAYVQQLGARLAATSERPGLPWTFKVVDDPTVNAFAVPGGHIYITRGILAALGSEAELAGVVGHEIGHVTARHTVAELSKQQLIGLGLGLGSMASSTVARHAGTINQALQILYLKFSRDDERQADDLGLRYMSRARFDPREMPDVFTMLQRVSEASGGGRVPEWQQTHPDPENRHARIAAEVAALPPQDLVGTTVDRDAYLQRLQDLVYGTDPRQGYFVGTRFIHPTLRFEVTFPQGWTTQNGTQAVVAVSAARDAMVELSQASEATPDAASQAFLAQAGITLGAAGHSTVNGLPAVAAPFRAATQSDTLRGTVAFVQLGGSVYRLVAYAPEVRWSANQAVAEQALRSFRPVTDPALLGVQPQRLAIVRLDRRTSIAELARRRASPVAAATLALLNNVAADSALDAGLVVKWVTGNPLPH
jgi:predicted Zn-dependent protease